MLHPCTVLNAGLRPTCEAPRDGRCRPADILCIPALALAQVLSNGARAIRTEPICLDIAVINALDAVTVRVEFMGRLAVVITRAATRAVQKRVWLASHDRPSSDDGGGTRNG